MLNLNRNHGCAYAVYGSFFLKDVAEGRNEMKKMEWTEKGGGAIKVSGPEYSASVTGEPALREEAESEFYLCPYQQRWGGNLFSRRSVNGITLSKVKFPAGGWFSRPCCCLAGGRRYGDMIMDRWRWGAARRTDPVLHLLT